MRVSACIELKASKSLDSFVKSQNGVYRKKSFDRPVLLHIHLQCSVLIAGSSLLHLFRFVHPWRPSNVWKRPLPGTTQGGLTWYCGLGYGPVQLSWNAEQRSEPGCFIFSGIGGTFSSWESITLSQWRSWKETKVCLLGASKPRLSVQWVIRVFSFGEKRLINTDFWPRQQKMKWHPAFQNREVQSSVCSANSQ